MPDPSELFTNVYVKGFGIEVHLLPDLLIIEFLCKQMACSIYNFKHDDNIHTKC